MLTVGLAAPLPQALRLAALLLRGPDLTLDVQASVGPNGKTVSAVPPLSP
jgi:hypothetical protein